VTGVPSAPGGRCGCERPPCECVVDHEHDCGANARVHDRGDECGQGVCVCAIMFISRTLALRRAARDDTKRLKPIVATIPPDTKLRIGNKRSATTYCDANSVTIPSAKTPAVCVIVTVNPRKAA